MSSELERIIEVLLFTATQPLSVGDILQRIHRAASNSEVNSALKEVSENDVFNALQSIQSRKKQEAIFLQEVAEGWRLASQPEYAFWARMESSEPRTTRLSQPALETLAVIAYRQPISRSEIEAVRGVAAGGVLETLLEKQIIRVGGRADVPGRPLLYETTPQFLEHFGLRNLSELPNVEELKRVHLPTPMVNTQQPELIHDAAAVAGQN